MNGFTHGLGHGIGVEVHENPSISQYSKKILKPGMVFTIEPGLYYPDQGWGLRLEDVMAVHGDARIQNLTQHHKKFILQLKKWLEERVAKGNQT